MCRFMAKNKKPLSVEMSSTDARETYEMLRAAHTLLRMAFGAVAMISSDADKERASALSANFNAVFDAIRVAAGDYFAISEQKQDAPAN